MAYKGTITTSTTTTTTSTLCPLCRIIECIGGGGGGWFAQTWHPSLSICGSVRYRGPERTGMFTSGKKAIETTGVKRNAGHFKESPVVDEQRVAGPAFSTKMSVVPLPAAEPPVISCRCRRWSPASTSRFKSEPYGGRSGARAWLQDPTSAEFFKGSASMEILLFVAAAADDVVCCPDAKAMAWPGCFSLHLQTQTRDRWTRLTTVEPGAVSIEAV